jgi:hypothetical protein
LYKANISEGVVVWICAEGVMKTESKESRRRIKKKKKRRKEKKPRMKGKR